MLHAELHGKLDPAATDLSRREDILTSTIFGTLLLADKGPEVLCQWLSCARRFEPDGRLGDPIPRLSSDHQVSYWFWPSLTEAEPDLLLRIGDRLFVIEAKYHASMGQGDDADEEPEGDDEQRQSLSANQLARQWRSCRVASARFSGYPSDLQSAIAGCELTLVYLVSAGHHARSMAELRASWSEIVPASGQPPRLCLLTWQDLHQMLVLESRHAPPSPRRWVGEIALLLARRDLAAFMGFAQSLGAWTTGSTNTALEWTAGWVPPQSRLPCRALDELDLQSVNRVASVSWWMPASGRAQQRQLPYRAFDEVTLRAIRQVALSEWWSKEPTFRWSSLAGLDLVAIHVMASAVWRGATPTESGEGL